MATPRGPLGRYRDIAWFLAKYGRGHLLDPPAPGAETIADDSPRDDAESLASDLEALGPTFIKLGQLLSTRADLLPRRYLDALARLQDNVAPFPFEEVEAIVQDELGLRLSKAFVEFDPVPVSSTRWPPTTSA